MIKLEQQQEKNQQFKKIENAFNKFSNFQANKTNYNNKKTLKEQQNEQQNNRKFSHFFYLIITYTLALFQLYKLVFYLTIQYFIGFFFKVEKFITNDIILLTGAGGYLGRCLALELAKRGAILALCDINEDGLRATSETLKSVGLNRFHLFAFDITDEKQLKDTSKQIRDKVGDVSMVIMAAASSFEPKSILELDYKRDIEKQFQVSYLSQLHLIQEFLPIMISKNHGHLVTISSSTAFMECSLITSYCSFKLAQAKLLETVREELLSNKIQDVKTSVVYLGLLNGGMASDFNDLYEFPIDMKVSGEYAAKTIVSGILKDKDVIFVPRIDRVLLCFKNILPPKVLHFIYSKFVKINPKYLKL